MATDAGQPSQGDTAAPEPGDPARYVDRQASELEYHARVLARAGDPSLPALERAKFLAIFSTLTDEFFRVRVAGLLEQHESRLGGRSRAGHTPRQELGHIRRRFLELATEQHRLYDGLLDELTSFRIEVVRWSQLEPTERKHLGERFEAEIFPILTPLAVGPAHPFPFISDLSLSLGVMVAHPDRGDRSFARVKIPEQLDRYLEADPVTQVETDDPTRRRRLVPVEEVVGAHLSRLFPGRELVGWHTFRVTRNADYDVEDVDVEDLVDAIASEVHERRFGHAVRLEVDESVPPDVRELLANELDLTQEEIYELPRPLDLSRLWELHALPHPDLHLEPFQPQPIDAFESRDPIAVFGAIREREILVQHPYDSFAGSTQRLIEMAADDPRVLAMKQTLYRTSGDSPIVRAMIRAAEAGKQAVVLVELKARFDEEANIGWARRLEEAGVHVVYGFVELKTHTKTALIVRADEDGQIRRYGHIATGNYNPSTAKVYEDLGLFTADPALTADLGELFNYLTGHSGQQSYRRLLVAPVTLKDRLLELIGTQAHAGGRVVLKVNNLSHVEVIDALYAASQAGADIDLIVRSICCLKPGIPGLSDTIRVRSIVGPFLEHSRILRFGHDPDPGAYLIGSADLMPRNLERRVEAVTPVDDPALRHRLDRILDTYLADDQLAWTMASDGTWSPPPGDGVDAQEELRRDAFERRDA